MVSIEYDLNGLYMQSLKNPDLNISSLQYGLSSPPHSVFTPESFRSLSFRSSSLRLEEWELRTEDRVSQILSERLQPLSLLRQQEVKKPKQTHKPK